MPRLRTRRPTTLDNIYAVCIDSDRTVLGPIFRVELNVTSKPGFLSKSHTISDLVDKIIRQQRLEKLLPGFNDSEITIWKLHSAISLSAFRPSSSEPEETDAEVVQTFIRNFDLSSKARRFRGSSEHKEGIRELFDSRSTPADHLHVVVEVPGIQLRIFRFSAISLTETLSFISRSRLSCYKYVLYPSLCRSFLTVCRTRSHP